MTYRFEFHLMLFLVKLSEGTCINNNTCKCSRLKLIYDTWAKARKSVNTIFERQCVGGRMELQHMEPHQKRKLFQDRNLNPMLTSEDLVMWLFDAC